MRFGARFGCRFGQPHDIRVIHENQAAKWEVCNICGRRFRWNKIHQGRTDNVAYLEAHVRNFAQPNGATKRVYMKIYHPDKCINHL